MGDRMVMDNWISLRQGAWSLDREWTLQFPGHWKVDVFAHKAMKIQDREEILHSIRNPVGSGGLESLVKPGDRVLVICDDISRPTRSDIILPILFEYLESLGLERTALSVLIASGTHAAMTDKETGRKLGEKICLDYKVHLHDHHRKGAFAGMTERGTPVYVNSLLSQADFIIGLGGIYPHNVAGFSGGAKLLLGVCSVRTILYFHHRRKGAPTGGSIKNDLRDDLVESARLAGMNFIINSTIDGERNITHVVAGDVEKAFEEGVDWCRKRYGVPPPDPRKYDLVIADTYPFDASYAFARKGWWPVRGDEPIQHKLILAAMVEGKGSHLVYPIPRDRIWNKWRRLWYELVAFGPVHFLTATLAIRFRSIWERTGLKMHNSGTRGAGEEMTAQAETGYPGRGVDILHCAEGSAKTSLAQLPNRKFSHPVQYVESIMDETGEAPVRVALYRCSALTFPLRNKPDN